MKRRHGYYDDFVKSCAKYSTNIAVRVYNDEEYKLYTYSELYGVCEYIAQNIQQISCSRGTIGLVTDRNAIIPSLIAASHRCSTTFLFISPSQDVQKIIENTKLNIVIHVKDLKAQPPNVKLFSNEPDKKIQIFDIEINIYNLQPQKFHIEPYCKIQHSFIAMTSGSTGEAKYINVPISCIEPNVEDLTKLFTISQNDVIYFSTPLTFDPSMVEILLACTNGASLLIAPAKADVLFPEDTENSVTVWQTTPSKFLQYTTSEMKNLILSETSTLKALALGGEPLNGICRLKECKNILNRTKIYTLYGVTEMSCWACVAELDLDKITDDKDVPLGNCLSETQIVIKESNECKKSTGNIILVSKTRKCTNLSTTNNGDNNSTEIIDTGDIGEKRNGAIYYRGRRDDMVKRYGNKVNLLKIEGTVMQCPRVKSCSCIWLPRPMLLVVYFTADCLTTNDLKTFLKCKLDNKHWPDKIVRVENLPMTPHGKTSKRMLVEMAEKSIMSIPVENSTMKVIKEELENLFNKQLTYDEIFYKDFFALGGTSFLAIAMSNKISVKNPELGNFILPYLVDPKYTIGQIMDEATKELAKAESTVKRLRLCEPLPTVSSSRLGAESRFKVVWSHETGKCVDASPTIFKHDLKVYVSVGSHSGALIVVSLSGQLRGTLHAGARLEASVAVCARPARGLVGAHDGTVLCFTLQSFAEVWRCNVGAMIKSSGVVQGGEFYVAAYDGFVRSIDVLTGEIKESIQISLGGISADLVLAGSSLLLVASLSGVCACVQLNEMRVVWRVALEGPVFARPALYSDDENVVFAEVTGTIQCFSVDTGVKLWEYRGAKGHIFSSVLFTRQDKDSWSMVFGCHDSSVYSVLVSAGDAPRRQWRSRMRSAVYAAPCSLRRHVLVATTSGYLCMLDAADGTLASEFSLPDQVYSSPVAYRNFIFVGCRDDRLYALKYNLR